MDSADHRALALETAQQGIVLLTNTAVGGKPLLPLKKKGLKSVAFVGPHANTSLGMLGNYFGGNALVFDQTPLVSARRSGMAANVTYSPGVPCYDVKHTGSRPAAYPLCVTEDTPDHSHIADAVATAKAGRFTSKPPLLVM